MLTLGWLKAPVVYMYSGGNYLLAVVVNFTLSSQYSQVFLVNESGWFNLNMMPNDGAGVLVTNTYQYGNWVYLTGFSKGGPLLMGVHLGGSGVSGVINLTGYLPTNLQPYALAVLNDTIYVLGITNGYPSMLLINLRNGSIGNLTNVLTGEWASSTPVSAALMPNGELLVLAMSSNLMPILGSLRDGVFKAIKMPSIRGLPLGLFPYGNEALIPVMIIKQQSSSMSVTYFSIDPNTYTMGGALLYYINGTVVNYTSCINPNAVIFDVYWLNSTTAILGGGLINGAMWEPYLAILNVKYCRSVIIPLGINGAVFAVSGDWVGGGLDVVYNITTLIGKPFITKVNYALGIGEAAQRIMPVIYFSYERGRVALINELTVVLLAIALIALIIVMMKVRVR